MDLSITIRFGYAAGLPTYPTQTVAPAAEEPAETEPVAPVDETEQAEAAAPADDDGRHVQGRGRGHRRHGFMQRAAHHLLRDVRHEMRDEVKELREAGDDEKADAVKAAYGEFKDDIRGVFENVGRGPDFDRAAVVAGLGQAMADFTAALRALNGTEEEEAPVEAATVDETVPAVPAPADDGTKTPTPDLPAGTLLDVGA
jgi:hypothetical protein